ncbi:hypothetical protein NKI88_31430, partial [Mesorhizobium sp. M0317]|uniref:hypothetical protein n=1 Tax=Mesorhizobium sp. M0317 TaxID=2956935 RepID=UPI003334FC71
TDGGPIESIKGSHSHILLEATWVQGRRPAAPPFAKPIGLGGKRIRKARKRVQEPCSENFRSQAIIPLPIIRSR